MKKTTESENEKKTQNSTEKNCGGRCGKTNEKSTKNTKNCK